MRTAVTVTAAVLSLALAAVGCWLVYEDGGVWPLVGYIVLCIVFFPVSVIIHELGHALFGAMSGMKVRLSRINPFLPSSSCTVMPLKSKNVRGRLIITALGGIVLNAVFLAFGAAAFFFGGLLAMLSFVAPSSLYLLAINALPFEYADGKTDMLAAVEAVREDPSAKVLLRVLEIQGMLSEGKKLEDIDEELLYSVPQLAEDDAAFIMLVSLRADYYRVRGDEENAAKWEQRLSQLKEYLPEGYCEE